VHEVLGVEAEKVEEMKSIFLLEVNSVQVKLRAFLLRVALVQLLQLLRLVMLEETRARIKFVSSI